jgi:hypothetical protein
MDKLILNAWTILTGLPTSQITPEFYNRMQVIGICGLQKIVFTWEKEQGLSHGQISIKYQTDITAVRSVVLRYMQNEYIQG